MEHGAGMIKHIEKGTDFQVTIFPVHVDTQYLESHTSIVYKHIMRARRIQFSTSY